MRRLTAAVAIFACAFSFVVVCLGGCFAPAPAGEHACCQGKEGWQAAGSDSDCCSVVPAISNGGGAVLASAAPIMAVPGPAFTATMPLWTSSPAVAAAPSPPLILRI
jgi:hypothetical protein